MLCKCGLCRRETWCSFSIPDGMAIFRHEPP